MYSYCKWSSDCMF